MTFTVTDGKVTDVLIDGVSVLAGGVDLVTDIHVEKTTLALPRGSTASGEACVTNPDDCCLGWECVDCECVEVPGGQYATEEECLTACCPVTVGCCEDPVSRYLKITFNNTGSGSPLDGNTYDLTWAEDPSRCGTVYGIWTADLPEFPGAPGEASPVNIFWLRCNDENQWVVTFAKRNDSFGFISCLYVGVTASSLTVTSCSPFLATGSVTMPYGGVSHAFTFTITE
jgi:hypothetical protein